MANFLSFLLSVSAGTADTVSNADSVVAKSIVPIVADSKFIDQVTQGVIEKLPPVSENHTALWVVIVVLFLLLIVSSFFQFKNWKEVISLKSQLKDLKLAGSEGELKIEEQIKTIKESIKAIESRLESLNSPNQSVRSTSTKDNSVQNKKTEEQQTTNVVTSSKYGDFYVNNGVPLVENRDLSVNPSDGTFVFTIVEGQSTGTYSVNEKAIEMILSDIKVIADYAVLDGNPRSFKKISVIKPGSVKKDGANWVILSKLKVKLI